MSAEMKSLLRKYNVPGPRYTSYPTVPYWDRTPTESEWLDTISLALAEAESENVGAAIYVHVPFCESLCTYCGCNTRITRNHGVSHPYIATVEKEWRLYLSRLGRETQGLKLSELHLGGGTPTFMTPAELELLVSGILKNTTTLPGAEFSIEADPRVTHSEHLERLASLGFRRLSLGIQDFDPAVQAIVNRVQTEAQVREVTESARRFGYTSINYDLIYGLPKQTLQSVRDTLQAVLRLKPDRIAFYAYAHVPWIKPGQRKFTEADLPEGADKRALYELGRELLEASGYREIGMDHFALETDSLSQATRTQSLHRNFMGYTSRQVSPLIGLGVSAIGDSWRAFVQNEKLLETYVSRVEKGEFPILRGHLLNDEDLAIRRHILNLMTRFETDWEKPSLWTASMESTRAKLDEFARDGLVKIAQNGLQVTEQGRAFVRNICMAFDARLARQAPATQLFSKTV